MLIKGIKIKLGMSRESIDLHKPIIIQKAIKTMKTTFSKLPKEKKTEKELLAKEIKTLRQQYKECITLVYTATFTKGKNTAIEEYSEPIKAEDLKHSISYYISETKAERAKYKKVNEDRKTMLGYSYATVGGVFLSDKSITKIATNTDPVRRIRENKAPHIKIMANYVGVELELIAKVDKNTLEKKFIEAGLAGYVVIKHDGSIRRDEDGEYPHEVAILCKQEYQKHIMQKVCAVLNSKDIAGYVNNSCGLHVHLDSRNRKVDVLYHNLVQALPMLKGMVPKIRTEGPHANNYCALNRTNDFSSKDHGSNNGRRYQAINPEAFERYKTIEVRLHSGSLNAAKISNWITILGMIADRNDKIPNKISNANDFGREFPVASTKLIGYIERRTETFEALSPGKADTRGDHYWIEETEFVA